MNATLAARLTPISNTMLRNIVLALAGSLIVAVAAQIRVPFWPVPMTLQTLAVLMIGGAYGARLGAATLGLYALEGAVGLPFFAGGKHSVFDANIAYLPGPTMGYVLGFIMAAALVGYIAQSGWIASAARMVMATLLGAALVYVPGLIWLAIWYVSAKGMTSADAVAASINGGFVPFLISDSLKAVIAGLGLAGGWSLAKR
jgi:biotin transport system substrate-specific component